MPQPALWGLAQSSGFAAATIQFQRGRRRTNRQSPPRLGGEDPFPDQIGPRRTGSSVVDCAFGLTKSYLRTVASVPPGATPLTRRLAPVVVLVVATRVAARSTEWRRSSRSRENGRRDRGAEGSADIVTGPRPARSRWRRSLPNRLSASWLTIMRLAPPSEPASQPVARETPPR